MRCLIFIGPRLLHCWDCIFTRDMLPELEYHFYKESIATNYVTNNLYPDNHCPYIRHQVSHTLSQKKESHTLHTTKASKDPHPYTHKHTLLKKNGSC
jgi:hypothetical protein